MRALPGLARSRQRDPVPRSLPDAGSARGDHPRPDRKSRRDHRPDFGPTLAQRQQRRPRSTPCPAALPAATVGTGWSSRIDRAARGRNSDLERNQRTSADGGRRTAPDARALREYRAHLRSVVPACRGNPNGPRRARARGRAGLSHLGRDRQGRARNPPRAAFRAVVRGDGRTRARCAARRRSLSGGRLLVPGSLVVERPSPRARHPDRCGSRGVAAAVGTRQGMAASRSTRWRAISQALVPGGEREGRAPSEGRQGDVEVVERATAHGRLGRALRRRPRPRRPADQGQHSAKAKDRSDRSGPGVPGRLGSSTVRGDVYEITKPNRECRAGTKNRKAGDGETNRDRKAEFSVGGGLGAKGRESGRNIVDYGAISVKGARDVLARVKENLQEVTLMGHTPETAEA